MSAFRGAKSKPVPSPWVPMGVLYYGSTSFRTLLSRRRLPGISRNKESRASKICFLFTVSVGLRFPETGFHIWQKNRSTQPTVAIDRLRKDIASFQFEPKAAIFYLVLWNVSTSNASKLPEVHITYSWEEVVNETRTLTREVKETLFRHWVG